MRMPAPQRRISALLPACVVGLSGVAAPPSSAVACWVSEPPAAYYPPPPGAYYPY